MVEGIASLIVEVLLPVMLFAVEVGLMILVASVRPWRYLLFPKFRAETNASYEKRHALVKWWHLTWGGCLVVASIVVVYGLYGLWSSTRKQADHRHGAREYVVEKAKKAVAGG